MNSEAPGKVYFRFTIADWAWNILFMLSLALVGLEFKPGNLLVALLLLREFKICREAFIIKLMFVFGGYAFTFPNTQWGVNLNFILFIVAIGGMFLLRKDKVLKRSIIAYVCYAMAVMLIALPFGLERLSVQLRPMLSFLTFCFFVIPLLCFNGRAFDIHEFWRQLMSLMLVVCVFYIIDAFVVRGWLLVPCAWFSFDNVSTWHSIVMYGPGGPIPRKYPPGVFPLALLVYPLARYYRLRWWQWGIVLVALGCTQTSTVIFALVIGYIICQGTVKKYLLYGVGAISLFTVLYYIDDSMGYTMSEQSTMRIASSVNQILALNEAEDDEDFADAGSGRIAQALPALEMQHEQHRELQGFGFIDSRTTNPRALVYCEFFRDPEMQVIAVTSVEITYLRVLLTLGWIGLIIWLLYYIGIYGIIHKLRYARYYINVVIIMLIYGVSGWSSLFDPPGLLITAMSYAVVLLANKPSSLKEYPDEYPREEKKDFII